MLKQIFLNIFILIIFICSFNFAAININCGFKGTGLALGFGYRQLSSQKWTTGYNLYLTTGYHQAVGNITWHKVFKRSFMHPVYFAVGPQITSSEAVGLYTGFGWLSIFKNRNDHLEIGLDLLNKIPTITAQYGLRL